MYIRRKFFWLPFWKVEVEMMGKAEEEKIDDICEQLEAAGAEKLSIFWWRDEDIITTLRSEKRC